MRIWLAIHTHQNRTQICLIPGSTPEVFPPPLPREAWPSDRDKVADIERDMLPGCVGDRRQV